MSKLADVIEGSADALRARWLERGGEPEEHERLHGCFPLALAMTVEVLRASEASLAMAPILDRGEDLARVCGQLRHRRGADASSVVASYGDFRELLGDAAAEAGLVPSRQELSAALRFFDRLAGGAASGVCEAGVSDLRAAEAEREAARSLERQLLGIVSHDLRTPLNAVVLGAQAMLRRGYLDDRHTAVAARILASGERATRLINDLLDFARVRHGVGLELRLRPTELGRVLHQAVEELLPAFPDRTVRVETQGPVEGEWDPDRLLQLASNLLTNACKYGRVGADVVVELAVAHGAARMAVHNEGPPIDPSAIATLFDPFQRGPDEPSPSGALQRSTGLGLFIVRHIAEAHGGTVSVTSTAEAGTTFTVTLPLSAPRASAGGQAGE